MTSTKRVLDNHLSAFQRGDLVGVLSDYAADAVFFTKDGPLRGVDAIRPFFIALIDEFRKPGAEFVMTHELIDRDYAYILWTGATADNIYEQATDTFVVRDGKIVAQSFAASITPRRDQREVSRGAANDGALVKNRGRGQEPRSLG